VTRYDLLAGLWVHQQVDHALDDPLLQPAIRNILAAAYLRELDALLTGWNRRGLVQLTVGQS
jgi:hypothetical protein